MTRRLRVIAVLLLLGALASGIVLLVRDAGEVGWDAEVAADGEAQPVPLEPGVRAVVWTYEADANPECSVQDREDGRAVQLHEEADPHRRSGGSAGDYVGTWTFEAPGNVLVRCVGVSGVYVEREPGVLAALGRIAPVPLLLTAAGLAAALAAAVSARRRGASTER